MPERNLVIHRSRQGKSQQNRTHQRFPVYTWVVVTALAIATQSGCTKLRNAALQDGLVPPSQSAIAEKINQEPRSDSARDLLGASTERLDAPQAKIVGVFEAVESNTQPKVTLTARMPGQDPPAPSIASASNAFVPAQSLAATEDCEHDGQCECHKTVVAPKLAVVEPFDPRDLVETEPKYNPVAPSIASAESPRKSEAETKLPDRYATNTNSPSARDLLRPILAKNPLPQPQRGTKEEVASTPSSPATKLVPLRPLGNEVAESELDATLVLQANPKQLSSGVIKLNAQPFQNSAGEKLVVAEMDDLRESSSDLVLSTTQANEDVRRKEVTSAVPWSPLRKIRVGEISPEMTLQASTSNSPVREPAPSTDVAVEQADIAMTAEERLSPKVEPIAATSVTTPAAVKVASQVIIDEEVGELNSTATVESSIVQESNVDSSPYPDGNFSPLDQIAKDNQFSPSPAKTADVRTACQCGAADCDCMASTEVAVELPVGELYSNAVEQFKREMASANQWVPPTNSERRSLESPESSKENIFQPKIISGSPVKLPSLDQIDQELATARGAANKFSPLPLPSPTEILPQPAESSAERVAQVGHSERLDAPMGDSVKTPVAVESPQPISLRQQVNETIAKVKFAIATETDVATKNGLEVNLRLLELLNQQTDQIDKSDRMINNDQKRSLQHQLDALSAMLANEEKSMDASATTLESLKQAVEELESSAELRVANGLFCTEISGFGKFKCFTSSTFSSNQKMLIYCEVENQTSIEVQNSTGVMEHRTKLLGRYVVYDRKGIAVQQEVFPPIEDTARNRRRDFYLYFPMQLKGLPAGDYRLELMIEDLNGNKTASLRPGIHFTVQ